MARCIPSRWVEWIAGPSLRVRLAVGFVAVVLLASAAGAASWRTQQRALLAVQEYLNVTDRVADLSLRSTTTMVKARKLEKEFLLHEREFGYDEAHARYVTLLQADIADLRENLQVVRGLTTDAATRELVDRIVETATSYETGFLRVVELHRSLGRTDTGLEGRLRERAHAIEAIVARTRTTASSRTSSRSAGARRTSCCAAREHTCARSVPASRASRPTWAGRRSRRGRSGASSRWLARTRTTSTRTRASTPCCSRRARRTSTRSGTSSCSSTPCTNSACRHPGTCGRACTR